MCFLVIPMSYNSVYNVFYIPVSYNSVKRKEITKNSKKMLNRNFTKGDKKCSIIRLDSIMIKENI